ncbi:hypothetical protein ACLOJK_033437 [Asimina triloba]
MRGTFPALLTVQIFSHHQKDFFPSAKNGWPCNLKGSDRPPTISPSARNMLERLSPRDVINISGTKQERKDQPERCGGDSRPSLPSFVQPDRLSFKFISRLTPIVIAMRLDSKMAVARMYSGRAALRAVTIPKAARNQPFHHVGYSMVFRGELAAFRGSFDVAVVLRLENIALAWLPEALTSELSVANYYRLRTTILTVDVDAVTAEAEAESDCGPGCGKGTQCVKIVETFGFTHLSAGDLLRKEIASNSENGAMILETIKDGKIVPSSVTVELIKRAIESSDNNKFLIDGFPRSDENRNAFERIVSFSSFLVTG